MIWNLQQVEEVSLSSERRQYRGDRKQMEEVDRKYVGAGAPDGGRRNARHAGYRSVVSRAGTCQQRAASYGYCTNVATQNDNSHYQHSTCVHFVEIHWTDRQASRLVDRWMDGWVSGQKMANGLTYTFNNMIVIYRISLQEASNKRQIIAFKQAAACITSNKISYGCRCPWRGSRAGEGEMTWIGSGRAGSRREDY